MACLSIALLGRFQVTLAGQPVTQFESDKVRALLAYLVVEAERPHRRQVLAGLLWPDRPERVARNNLRHALPELRTAIGDRQARPPFLLITRESIQFNQASDYWLDVHIFRTLSEMAEVAQLEAAVDLHQGPFLEGFSLKDSSTFEDWALLIEEQLQRQMLAALRQLAAHYEGCGQYERACEYAWRQVDLAPWQEEAHRQLMRLLALSGQRSAALTQYETCRRLLAEELGVEPAAETVALYEQICEGELSRGDVVPARLASRSATPPHNLPPQLTPFIGRKKELAQIARRLNDPNCRLLTLVGPGGSGKTRLALQAVQGLIDGPVGETPFADGLYFIPLVSLRSPDTLIPTIAERLSFTFYQEVEPKQQLLAYLREKELLLILDNFEHLLKGATLLTDILLAAPAVKIVVTSREVLDLREEWLCPVDGLEIPQSDPVGGTAVMASAAVPPALETYSAVQLFAQCARQVRPGFNLAAEQEAVIRICRLVDGLPLGIELSAGWLKILPGQRIAQEIESSLDFLATSQRDVSARHRSMRAVLNHSWGLLSSEETLILRRLSVFRGTFQQEAAAAVTGASLPVLAALVEKSLLHPTPAGHYHLHELVRQFAAEKLEAVAAEEAETQDRHSVYYCAFLQQRGGDLKGSRQQAALAEIDRDIENALAAWNWAVRQGQIERLAQAIDGLHRFFEWRGRLQEGEATCQKLVERLTEMTDAAGEHLLAKAWAWQGIFSNSLGNADLARQALQQSLALLEQLELAGQNTRSEQAFTLLQMGHRSLLHIGDKHREVEKAKSRHCCEQSLALYQALNDRWEVANALEGLGDIAAEVGHFDEAERLFAESLTIRQTLGDQRGSANSLLWLGRNALWQGNFEEAEPLIRESIAAFQEMGAQAQAVQGLENLGIAMMFLGKFIECIAAQEAILVISHDLGLRPKGSLARANLALAKILLGRYEQGRADANLSLSLAREDNNSSVIGHACLGLGAAALAEQRYIKAHQWFKEGFAAYRSPDGQSWTLACWGYAVWGLDDPRQTQQKFYQALQVSIEIGAFFPLIIALPGVALFLADQGQKELAVEVYALASRYPFVANSRFFEDVAGRPMALVAATLSSEVVAQAQERGRARDLWATAAELLAELDE